MRLARVRNARAEADVHTVRAGNALVCLPATKQAVDRRGISNGPLVHPLAGVVAGPFASLV